MPASIAALMLSCRDLPAAVAFYRAAGFPLVETRHGGATQFTATLGAVHVALSAAAGERGAQDGVTIAVTADRLDATLQALRELGALVVQPPAAKPWGLTAVVADPDGRRVELIQTRVEMTGPMPL